MARRFWRVQESKANGFDCFVIFLMEIEMANITTELQPFKLPVYVLEKVPAGTRQEGFKEAPKHRLCDLSEETLVMLCDEFKDSVLKKSHEQAEYDLDRKHI